MMGSTLRSVIVMVTDGFQMLGVIIIELFTVTVQ